jgi:hypothetical protein
VVPPVRPVEHLPATVVAQRGVRRYEGPGSPSLARNDDGKFGRTLRRDEVGLEPVEACQRWQLRSQAVGEPRDGRLPPFNLDGDSVGVVDHEAGQLQFGGNPMHGRPESDALDRAAAADAQPSPRIGHR